MYARTSASVTLVVKMPTLALHALPGQGRAHLHSGQCGNDFHRGATGLYSREAVQQTVTKDAKDGGMVTWETRGEASHCRERHLMPVPEGSPKLRVRPGTCQSHPQPPHATPKTLGFLPWRAELATHLHSYLTGACVPTKGCV